MKTLPAKLITKWNEHDWTHLETQDVVVIGWDRDKYFMYKDINGVVDTAKCGNFLFKRSNKMYYLPEIVYEEDIKIAVRSHKDAAREIKGCYKRKVEFDVWSGQEKFKFKTLRKAMRFCISKDNCTSLVGYFSYKNTWSSIPLLEKENGEWTYYRNDSGFVSNKTLAKR